MKFNLLILASLLSSFADATVFNFKPSVRSVPLTDEQIHSLVKKSLEEQDLSKSPLYPSVFWPFFMFPNTLTLTKNKGIGSNNLSAKSRAVKALKDANDSEALVTEVEDQQGEDLQVVQSTVGPIVHFRLFDQNGKEVKLTESSIKGLNAEAARFNHFKANNQESEALKVFVKIMNGLIKSNLSVYAEMEGRSPVMISEQFMVEDMRFDMTDMEIPLIKVVESDPLQALIKKLIALLDESSPKDRVEVLDIANEEKVVVEEVADEELKVVEDEVADVADVSDVVADVVADVVVDVVPPTGSTDTTTSVLESPKPSSKLANILLSMGGVLFVAAVLVAIYFAQKNFEDEDVEL